MKRLVIARIFAILCFFIGCYFIAVSIENWESYTLMRKCFRVFACFGWICIVYEVYMLKFSWIRKFIKQEN